MLEEEEDKDKEDEAEWSLGHGSQAQIQAIMQTHSLAALGHEDAAPRLTAFAGDRRGGKSPHAHPCYPAWVVSMGLSLASPHSRKNLLPRTVWMVKLHETVCSQLGQLQAGCSWAAPIKYLQG